MPKNRKKQNQICLKQTYILQVYLDEWMYFFNMQYGYRQWGRNGFYLGEDPKKFKSRWGSERFFPNIIIVFYEKY